MFSSPLANHLGRSLNSKVPLFPVNPLCHFRPHARPEIVFTARKGVFRIMTFISEIAALGIPILL